MAASEYGKWIKVANDLGLGGDELKMFVKERHEEAKLEKARADEAEREARKMELEAESKRIAAEQEAKKLEFEEKKQVAEREAESKRIAAEQETKKLMGNRIMGIINYSYHYEDDDVTHPAAAVAA